MSCSADDARPAAGGDLLQFVNGDLARVAARALQHRAVAGAEVHRLLRAHAVEEAVYKPAGETVAAADAILDGAAAVITKRMRKRIRATAA